MNRKDENTTNWFLHNQTKFIGVDQKELNELKIAYEQAVISGESEFTFKGRSWYRDYAKYAIMYMEDVMEES